MERHQSKEAQSPRIKGDRQQGTIRFALQSRMGSSQERPSMERHAYVVDARATRLSLLSPPIPQGDDLECSRKRMLVTCIPASLSGMSFVLADGVLSATEYGHPTSKRALLTPDDRRRNKMLEEVHRGGLHRGTSLAPISAREVPPWHVAHQKAISRAKWQARRRNTLAIFVTIGRSGPV